MKILVIKTCDGDVYYGTARNKTVNEGLMLAADQVINNDLDRYSQEDRERVRIALASGNAKVLRDTLTDVGAVREVRVN